MTCLTCPTRQALVEEVANLRKALVSRSTIDMAKGMVMAERRCAPEEAFKILRKLSNDANVKLHLVAEALVSHASVRE